MQGDGENYRTISEVASLLDLQTHVLRFWESRFEEISPAKRRGGRRFYSIHDVKLIDGIRRLLHVDGLTIRGVQKVLAEKGEEHVSSLSSVLDVEGSSANPDGGAAGDDSPEVGQEESLPGPGLDDSPGKAQQLSRESEESQALPETGTSASDGLEDADLLADYAQERVPTFARFALGSIRALPDEKRGRANELCEKLSSLRDAMRSPPPQHAHPGESPLE